MTDGVHCGYARNIYGQIDLTLVEHWYCDDYPDGTITDFLTGEIAAEVARNMDDWVPGGGPDTWRETPDGPR